MDKVQLKELSKMKELITIGKRRFETRPDRAKKKLGITFYY